MDPNYPDLKYPYPGTGYDWESPSGRSVNPGLRGPEPSPELLLTIAKAAQQKPEIRENFLAEARYEGELLDDGKFQTEPAVGAEMMDSFYAGYVKRHGQEKDYTLNGIWQLTELMRAWASDRLTEGDDAAALAFLTPGAAQPFPRSSGTALWRWTRLILILLLIGLLVMMYFEVFPL